MRGRDNEVRVAAMLRQMILMAFHRVRSDDFIPSAAVAPVLVRAQLFSLNYG
jgi:hypothetical protein